MAKSGYVDKDNPNVNYSDLFGQVLFVYKNWKGIIEERRVTPIEITFTKNNFHDDAQWFLRGYCHTRLDVRDFALEDIVGSIRHVRRRNNDAHRTVLAAAEKRREQERAATSAIEHVHNTSSDGDLERLQRLTKSTPQVTIEHKK